MAAQGSGWGTIV